MEEIGFFEGVVIFAVILAIGLFITLKKAKDVIGASEQESPVL